MALDRLRDDLVGARAGARTGSGVLADLVGFWAALTRTQTAADDDVGRGDDEMRAPEDGQGRGDGGDPGSDLANLVRSLEAGWQRGQQVKHAFTSPPLTSVRAFAGDDPLDIPAIDHPASGPLRDATGGRAPEGPLEAGGATGLGADPGQRRLFGVFPGPEAGLWDAPLRHEAIPDAPEDHLAQAAVDAAEAWWVEDPTEIDSDPTSMILPLAPAGDQADLVGLRIDGLGDLEPSAVSLMAIAWAEAMRRVGPFISLEAAGLLGRAPTGPEIAAARVTATMLLSAEADIACREPGIGGAESLALRLGEQLHTAIGKIQSQAPHARA